MSDTLPFGFSVHGNKHTQSTRPNSPKQRSIIGAVKANGTITLAEAKALVGGNVYTNEPKHTGALLSDMVKRGMLVRVRPGVFSLPNSEAAKDKTK